MPPNDDTSPLPDAAAPDECTIAAYVAALIDSKRLGHLVVHHRILPAAPAVYADPMRPFPRPVAGLLAGRGIGRLYAHQARATDLTRAGRHVAVATPTASGKTLTYLLPVLEEIIKNPDSRAIFLYPLKALAQDQLKAINELTAGLPESARPTVAIYDGDTTAHFRRKIRDNPPHILITNPEMLHLSLLPGHDNWSTLFAGLTHVVVDEMHTYRGVMGSHMAHVFRRLGRVCRRFGSQPSFVFSSATIGNPGELATDLTGLPVETVTESGAPTAARHFLFINPEQSAATTAVMLLAAALRRGLRTIVYTQSRKMTELISLWIREKAGPYASRVSAYRSGFLPQERRDIEAAMASGKLLGVVSTSALELGIDIGGLDLCILCGYPGSVMSAWQRGGRVGRAGRESAVALIAGEDALDQYFMRHPAEFFDRPPESAVINPANPVIAAKHLECAAAELPILLTEPYLADPAIRREAESLAARGLLLRDKDGTRYFAARKRPHRDVNLRGSGGQFTIEAGGAVIGQIDELRAYKETHPGAVYIHRGVSYLVKSLDIPERRVVVIPGKADYYTRARGQKTTDILEVLGEGSVHGVPVFLGRLRVTETVTGYERRSTRGGQLLTIVPLDLPPMIFETEGLWWVIPQAVQAELDKRLFHFMGAIHAMEHAMIGILPLLVLTDRNDLGGISTPLHPQVGRACVFVYDGAPGGVGLTRLAFSRAGEALTRTLAAVAGCPCETGCPSCVHSPKCGSGNRPIDKIAARYLLELLMSGKLPETEPCRPDCNEQPQANEPQATSRPKGKAPARFGVLDVETRRAAADVGGWGNAHKMGISVAVLYDSGTDEFIPYSQDELPALYEALAHLDLIVGFNILRFDYKVLDGAAPLNHRTLPTLDILERVHARLGYRLSLDGLAKATLGTQKSASGLDALTWWKEGRLDEITTYCKQDVAVTRDLYLFGRDNGYLLFTNKAGKIVRLPVEWA
ncbi:DEAD/DEAH box helicase [Desulfovibrio aerotolerans]|uniref:DEAD/DEAH box helicase n=1 Tax=Solidesulfovibrio aerotolerans TaxID=295255 RepID=A0A7C9ILC0_9BACT|nr:DEAD/DEAH box helicase [Solidesulfovibrio aerotolerans]MYL83761.1 DEAD/DEAH box helicase [Solidesulfovibrio aerotolerans]